MSFRSYRYESFDPDAFTVLPAQSQEALGKEEEIWQAARREGFDAGHARGFAEGREAALRDAEASLVRDLPAALAGLGEAVAKAEAARQANEQDALLLVRTVLRQLLPKLADRVVSLELAAQVANVVAGAQTPHIEIRCAEKTRDVVRRVCGPLPAGVELVVDPALSEGSLACTWADGSASFNADALTEAILSIIERSLSGAQAVEHQAEQS